MEHLRHFGLSDDPFRNEPRLNDFFETTPARDALARLDRGLRQARGLMILTGDVGSGKTMLVRRLLDNLEEEIFEASMLVVLNGTADATWMLTRFARLLGIEEPEVEREKLLAQVYEQLAIVREDGRQAVLIIDDAHALASPATLAEVCGLLKLEYEERRLFSLVLTGGRELEASVSADPTLSHRVEVKVEMESLDAGGSAAYLEQRVRKAGGAPAILEPEAVGALHALGRGLPGLMNILADNALFEAFLCGRQLMTRTDVERAHRDLGWADEGGAGEFAVAFAASTASAELAESADAPLELIEPIDGALGDLDSDLEAVFDTATQEATVALPVDGPPKEDDLVAELLDD